MKTTANAGIGFDQNGINAHGQAQVGDLNVKHQESHGFFHNAVSSSWNCFGIGNSQESSSSITNHGYDATQSNTTHFGKCELGSSETSHIGKDGFNYHANYNFFGKKLNWGFHIPAMPDLGIMKHIHAFWQNICHILSAVNFIGGLKEAGDLIMKIIHPLIKLIECIFHVFMAIAKAR